MVAQGRAVVQIQLGTRARRNVANKVEDQSSCTGVLRKPAREVAAAVKNAASLWGWPTGGGVNQCRRGVVGSPCFLAPVNYPFSLHLYHYFTCTTTAMRQGCCTLLVLPVLVQPVHPFAAAPVLAVSPIKRCVKCALRTTAYRRRGSTLQGAT